MAFSYRNGYWDTFEKNLTHMPLFLLQPSLPATTDLPEFFIASYKWPGWTHGPLDQKNCAASWAFSTASNKVILITSLQILPLTLEPETVIKGFLNLEYSNVNIWSIKIKSYSDQRTQPEDYTKIQFQSENWSLFLGSNFKQRINQKSNKEKLRKFVFPGRVKAR